MSSAKSPLKATKSRSNVGSGSLRRLSAKCRPRQLTATECRRHSLHRCVNVGTVCRWLVNIVDAGKVPESVGDRSVSGIRRSRSRPGGVNTTSSDRSRYPARNNMDTRLSVSHSRCRSTSFIVVMPAICNKSQWSARWHHCNQNSD